MRPAELFRSSTFRLALLYMVLFAGSVLLLLGFIYWSTVRFMSQQLDTTIETEIVGLAERYRDRGLNGLVRTIQERLERSSDSSAIYLLASPSFRPLAGNLARWPEGLPSTDGWLEFNLDDPAAGLVDLNARGRVFILQGNFKLLVGRDVRELQATQQLIERALLWGLAITVGLALAGGFMLSRTLLRRLEEINTTSREIMAGDLSRRIPVRGRQDDFDQLAGNLNAMLDEIERLMDGIRHVSDNIAHDLRTPLTRLRQRLESLVGDFPEHSQHRGQIEQTITDADQLLNTFSALLRIARIEAGTHRTRFVTVELGDLVKDAADLYSAIAEDAGLEFSFWSANVATIEGDKDLIFQAITNLLDNAVKYTPAGGQVELSLRQEEDRVVLCVADNGPGIPESERTSVTRRFYRLERSRTTPGSGLGLSLVAAVAGIHQAEFSIEDNNPGLRAVLRFVPGLVLSA